jgi:predicted DNA-binding transcriptional regulator YafY
MAGRDQVRPMRRLARLMAVLDQAGQLGASAERLIEVADYGDADAGSQLSLDLKRLRDQGWQIDNIAGVGEPARYRMVAGDNRLRLKLTKPQLAALQRAVILADRADLAQRLGLEPTQLPPGLGSEVLPHDREAVLTLALRAVQLRSLIRFVYMGKARVVTPGTVRFQHVQWDLTGVEDGDDLVKHFAVARMREVTLDPPGSALWTPEVRRLSLHPLTWEVDEPMQVTLRTARDHVPDVQRWLDRPAYVRTEEDSVELTYAVTNRSAFRARIYALGTRVEIVGPESFRGEVLTDLRDMVGL